MNSDTEKTSKKKVTLTSAEGWELEVDKSILAETNIKCDDIFFRNVSRDILSRLIEYCKRHHFATEEEKEEIKAFDDAFVNLDENTLVDLYMGAVRLGIKSLISLTRQALEGLRQPTLLPVKTEMRDLMPGVELPDPHRIKEEETQKEMICLKSLDGETFEVEKSVVALASLRVRHIIEENHGVSKIFTPIPAWLLVKAIEYCKLVGTATEVRAILARAATDVHAIATLAEVPKIKSFVTSLDRRTAECLRMVSSEMEIRSLYRLLRLNDFERVAGKVPYAAIPKVFPWYPPPSLLTVNNLEAGTPEVFPSRPPPTVPTLNK